MNNIKIQSTLFKTDTFGTGPTVRLREVCGLQRVEIKVTPDIIREL